MWYTVLAKKQNTACELAHMQHIIKPPFAQLRFWHGLVLFSILILALLGQAPDSQCGWLTCPPRVPSLPAMYRRRKRLRPGLSLRGRLHSLWRYVTQSWPQPVLRSFLLALLWCLSGRQGPAGIIACPWLLWLWQVVVAGWPELKQQRIWCGSHWLLWQGQRLLLVGYLGLTLRQLRPVASKGTEACTPVHSLFLGLGCQYCDREEPWVEVIRGEEGGYQATLCGHFTIQVSGDHPFRTRMLMLFLAWLDVPGHHRRSRRTRDGRTPFVRQRQLAEWFELPQPDVSRIAGYWQRGAWPELLSRCTPEILTPELIRRIVTVCATYPHWNREEVYQHLRGQEVLVSQRQVRQAMEQSGWSTLRQELKRRYHWTPEAFRLHDKWLVQELLRQVHLLQTCLESGQQPPTEEQIALTDLQALVGESGVVPDPPVKMTPWLLRVKQVIFGDWQMVEDDTIRCPECGSRHIGYKSRKPRMKKFYDTEGNLQEVGVYRYYCRNQACPRKSFTHLPPGLVPYSRHRLEVHLLAGQAYAWGYSTYRRVGQTLQVSEMTIYRWVSAWGQNLLPVAAIFGVVRSSGVVGVDEKYVLVPKNDKPAAKMKRWMYVYLAVDVYTYDLLHIAIYSHNTSKSAHAFLLALHTKGYHPRVVVTDLRRDYGSVIAVVFSEARHHECLFHAEQEVSRHLRKTLGRNYAEQHPAAEEVRQAMVKMFQVRTKRTAQKRYRALLDQQDEYVQGEPSLQWVFDFLEQHWPYLVNAVECQLIPATNNAVEMVIRRFDQHYQNFCGFESIETAQVYLGVFEKVYRFTPFSRDARPEIRGKSPLQLAGYDLSRMPMTWLCRGYSLDWPVTLEPDDVPNL
jgi:transposase-like protein/DNA-directed RNA polymerase subunit RPC12/RpoP